MAKSMSVQRYSEKSLRSAVEQFEAFMVAPEDVSRVPRALSECGVRFVVVESLPGSKIDGVCFWLDDYSPVIGMSTRYDRIDNFWFVLRHEIEHVLHRHGRDEEILDDLEGSGAGTDSSVPEEERIANGAASDFCVPAARLDSFILRKRPFFYEKDVLAFSGVVQRHPGVVVGQMQRRLNDYAYLRRHQAKVRHLLTPGAMTDGWGQAAQVSI